MRRLRFLFAALVAALSVPLALIALLVRLTSRGPIFYRQERTGLDGKPFTIYKFRSMYDDAERDTGPVWTRPDDPRVTPFGRFLRRSNIDELPQLWNVLRGDMSIVGPRPERPFFVEQFKHRIPQYMLRHKVKAGITGWAQVNGWRGNTSLEKRIEYDLYYIENWSVTLDLKIMWLTLVRGVLPQEEPKVSDVGEKMVIGTLDDLRPGEFGIILGRDLARTLGVTVGDATFEQAIVMVRDAEVAARTENNNDGDVGHFSRTDELNMKGLLDVLNAVPAEARPRPDITLNAPAIARNNARLVGLLLLLLWAVLLGFLVFAIDHWVGPRLRTIAFGWACAACSMNGLAAGPMSSRRKRASIGS